jgi:hypothetical protein
LIVRSKDKAPGRSRRFILISLILVPVKLTIHALCGIIVLVSTLAEIERAADALPAHEKQELLLFLASRLRAEGAMPEPREFTKEQIEQWIVEDEAELREFKKQG